VWFKIIPTKIEKYSFEKAFDLFLKLFFENFIFFSIKHAFKRAISRKKHDLVRKIGKLKTTGD